MAVALSPSVRIPTGNETAETASQSARRLRKSAQEFEAILLQSWLEKMNHSFVGSSDSQDAAHDTLSSLGTQAIATALAARGGIGIARMLLRQLQPKGDH
jgi:Rod binding domain-containing protein